MAEATTANGTLSGKDATKSSRTVSSGGAQGPNGAGDLSLLTAPPKLPLAKIYALPIPIRTFPLPTFYPNNPISLIHLVIAWLGQIFWPPAPEPSVVHIGFWDPDTRSVHIVDPVSIRALWEQGFFGKGSLSRSEPNWLKRELARRGSLDGKTVSEARTEQRREERRQAKWERAKAELEAIERQRLAEAAVQAAAKDSLKISKSSLSRRHSLEKPSAAPEFAEKVTLGLPSVNGTVHMEAAASRSDAPKPHVAASATRELKAPVGPAELLALPNSLAELRRKASEKVEKPCVWKAPVGPQELLALPNSAADLEAFSRPARSEVGVSPKVPAKGVIGKGDGSLEEPTPNGVAKGISTPTSSSNDSMDTSAPAGEAASPKRRKSVRFSPTVESTTFLDSDPPSPNHSLRKTGLGKKEPMGTPHVEAPSEPTRKADSRSQDSPATPSKIENKEHFQLSPEEAFFLVFSLGALSVVDRTTGQPIPAKQLLTLFCSHSYFPPRPADSSLAPNDPFLIHYAVYHHFRSLGWVPRHGIKFGVDWLIYQRGPVFDHSEFGVIVMPSYSDPQWERHEHEETKRTWAWLMGVNRVLSHVLKSLVLVYVDVPAPPVFEQAMRSGGISEALKKYSIREVMVRRFSVNRNR
ncbi:uncharacterized protein CTHT_0069270 [Thermochaetoides thermophila DSM 1495]|uniref:tRNA-intron lyase n=1 Tax=Chaetomium thermophilum (strain DSM 1495 / CBS 144.50 / IMI 039719) TaxID=759272 RepID=G0SHA1_CHATD|nr:hypothetical protein CTHT_0069270 [Thermochaetoides thermophila DSM 1495]EGS17590.1 hypothetical protein CTHT_0069270 [Thermochaetoides thermophila DSM 1495]